MQASTGSVSSSHSGPQLTRARLLDENSWRSGAELGATNSSETILVGFWRDTSDDERRYCAPVLDSHFTIEILLCSAVVVCFRNGRRVANGIVGYGGTQITSPGEKIELSFRKPIEAIHLFVPLSVVASAYEEVEQSRLPSDYRMTDPAYASDLVMAKLGEVLYRESELQGQFGSLFLRSLAMAALARAMGFEPDSDPGRNRGGLAPWRLARAIKFIEDHVGDDLSLDEIAKHAGLSRMHFAAQFRKATGRSPHSFLMARRIELSKMLLTEGKMPLVQVAFTAGFSSQAHFTTVFRKVVGVTPGRWRQAPIIREQGRGATPLAADQEDDL